MPRKKKSKKTDKELEYINALKRKSGVHINKKDKRKNNPFKKDKGND